MSQLPIEAVMPQLLAAVKHQHQVILKAAPGAGKSTYFPLQLIQNQVVTGKVIMLEPRRLAARNIARYLAEQLGEQVGQRVGYRVRGETKVSASTQLEIVTEGVMTRMIQNDPELDGVDLLIFDEFHVLLSVTFLPKSCQIISGYDLLTKSNESFFLYH
ncbi:DEAD/DEAH box helicase [Vibrio parahaemolyticus]